MYTKGTTFPTEAKIGIHLDNAQKSVPFCYECSPVRKTSMFENVDLY